MKACLISLGCPKNLTDSEVLMGKLALSGYTLTADRKKADIIIVNTCAFLKSARDESISTIRQIAKSKKKSAKIYIAGCLPELLEKQGKNMPLLPIDGMIDSLGPHGSYEPKVKATYPWTAYVKISEGCENFCSYCLIPTIRGKRINREIDDILVEVKELVNRGVKEIIFIAQDTTAYPGFAALLRKTAKISGIHWIRIMYSHPAHITQDFIDAVAEEKKICKYLDLPLQHICDKILAKMRRRMGRYAVLRLIDNIRRNIEGIAIRTSFIVGFPGENKADFEELVDFIKEVKFERLGVFKFSREEGTPAYNMRGQVPKQVKEHRFHKLMILQKQVSRELNNKLIGETVEVLLEKRVGQYFVGRTYMDAPEIDGSVKVFGSSRGVGEFIKAKVTKAAAYDLTAVCIT